MAKIAEKVPEKVEQNKQLILNKSTAISPLDGRYWEKVKILSPYTSESALIKTRVEVEAKYIVALSEVGLVRRLAPRERETLLNFGQSLSPLQVERVKEIEDTIRHDVKAMERAFREFVAGSSLTDATEMIHFALTSEDTNNLSYRLMLKRSVHQVCAPAVHQLVNGLADMANTYKTVPMLARTHGQPAVPTTLGKELAVIAVQLDREVRKIEKLELTGKLNGAVGNFNAHVFAAPEVNWIEFSKRFVKGFGLKPNLFTTQINPYEDMIQMFQGIQRVNNVVIKMDQDIWRYISDDWFVQVPKKGEVGSSTMPQKVNPIDFENSEGNAIMANTLLEAFCRELPRSRLQRHLSDSTMIRNVGSALAYGLLAHENALVGLGRIKPNPEVIGRALDDNWAILTEGVQTLLRREGVADPYSMVADLAKGQKIGRNEWNSWVSDLKIADETKSKLMKLTPESYIGYAVQLTDAALGEIERSNKDLPPKR